MMVHLRVDDGTDEDLLSFNNMEPGNNGGTSDSMVLYCREYRHNHVMQVVVPRCASGAKAGP